MNEIQTRMEKLIDEAASPEFKAFELHRLSAQIEISKILEPFEKELLQRRIRIKFEMRYAATFQEGPCGWKKETA